MSIKIVSTESLDDNTYDDKLEEVHVTNDCVHYGDRLELQKGIADMSLIQQLDQAKVTISVHTNE